MLNYYVFHWHEFLYCAIEEFAECEIIQNRLLLKLHSGFQYS